MTTVKDFQDNLAKDLFNMTREEAIAKSICIDCKEEALPKCYSENGRKEYLISGLCELCYDKAIKE